MTFGEQARSVLVANDAVKVLVAGRVFPQVMPDRAANLTFPAAVYSVVHDKPTNSLLGSTGKLRHAIVQIDCYGRKYLEAQGLADAVVGALAAVVGSDFTSMLDARRDSYDDEAQLHRVSLDFRMSMTEE